MEPLRGYEGDVWDRRQESRLTVGETVQVKRLGKGWLYVISDTTEGYAKEAGVFICTRRHYERYRELLKQKFQVVLKAGRYIDGQYFRVGTVLPLFEEEEKTGCSRAAISTEKTEQYGVLQETGSLQGREIQNRENAPVLLRGYLPFTERQIRLQMERMFGIPYSWGDERGDGMDCSSTVRAFFACFGFSLPRNSEEQREYGEALCAMNQAEYVDLRELSGEEKRKEITSLGIGAVLHMPGHVMLYAGEKDGAPLIFHNCDTYTENGEERIVRKCVLSEFLPKGEGTYLDYLTAAWKYRAQN